MNRFAKLAWTALGWTVLDILWGAFVRASGSGQGCGNRWPSCNGQVIPNAQSIATMIEFTHRAITAVLLLLVLGLLVWGWRRYGQGSQVRLGVTGAAVFLLLEAALGAALVFAADKNAALYAVLVAVHLLNTFFLLAFMALTAWWATTQKTVSLQDRGLVLLFGLGLAGVAMLGMAGALTALGDTLYPVTSLGQGLAQDADPGASFLIHVRVYHPLIGILVGLYSAYLLRTVYTRYKNAPVRRLVRLLGALILVQLAAGVVNLLLLAPIWMQVIHLFLADMVWISYVLLSVSTLSVQSEQEVL